MLAAGTHQRPKLVRRFVLGWCWLLAFLTIQIRRSSLPSIRSMDEELSDVARVSANDHVKSILEYPTTTSALPSVAIFYHLFIPSGNSSSFRTRPVLRARRIVQEQLRQLHQALETIPNLSPSVLYYTSVGTNVGESFVHDICGNLTSRLRACRRLQHLDRGFEDQTLAALYDHCVQNTTDRVIYFHSKGSFHSNRGQDNWRRHMTDAIASRDCVETAHLQNCDLCGLLFVPRPSLHFTGNMFNAKCSHIRKLIPPLEFEARMESVYQKARQGIQEGNYAANLFRIEEPWNSGTQRYAMEHWHASHPDLDRICDLSNHPTNKYWKNIRLTDRSLDDLQFGWFPRRPQPGMPPDVAFDESKRKREYFLLPGQLLKWFDLYGRVPAISSWVWTWYPDGPFWKEQVQKHGTNAVQIVSSQWRRDKV